MIHHKVIVIETLTSTLSTPTNAVENALDEMVNDGWEFLGLSSIPGTRVESPKLLLLFQQEDDADIAE